MAREYKLTSKRLEELKERLNYLDIASNDFDYFEE